MTKVVDGALFVAHERLSTCELCGKIAELRPYGPNGERICFECGMKNIKTTEACFQKVLDGVNVIVDMRDETKPN